MKSIIESKLERIRMDKEKVLANYNALSGAEQVLLELLKECEVDTDEQDSDD